MCMACLASLAAFSPDTSLREDYKSDNEENRKFQAAAKTARDAIAKVVDRQKSIK